LDGDTFKCRCADWSRGALPLRRAVPICIYMVAQAKKYVPGSGGPTDLIVLADGGKVVQTRFGPQFDTACATLGIQGVRHAEIKEHPRNLIFVTNRGQAKILHFGASTWEPVEHPLQADGAP
jgi:hypothetical protein